MDEASISQYIADTFEGVDTVVADGSSFFFYDPEHMFPFATIVTSDAHDSFSDLSRPSVFRLNIGVSRDTFCSLLGAQPFRPASKGGEEGIYDFTDLDVILPHPVYGAMYWLCVLNPGEATIHKAQELLAEAYQIAVQKQMKKRITGGD